MPIYSIAAGVCAGIASVFLFGAGAWVGAGVLVLGAGALCSVFLRRTTWLFAALFLFAVALGIARTAIYIHAESEDVLPAYAGEERVVEGRVVNDPERRENALHVHIAVEKVGEEEASGKLLAILSRDARVRFNDRIVVSGKISLPESFETDAGRVFDYPGYLRARGIFAVMRYGTLLRAETGGVSVRGTLFDLKHVFEASVERSLPEPDASLVEGMLLGERRGIPEHLNDALIVAGLIHIVVLSGYNISIVAEQVLRLFGLFVRKNVALMLGACAIVLFVVMVGAGATAVRAGVMGIIAIVARYVRRPAAALRALACAVAAMVLWNPASLLYDPSFVLSVLATFGLITLAPWAERRVEWLPEFQTFSVRSIAASTIGVQLYILPALLYYTGIVSVWALPANVLALPLVPAAMLSGFLTGVIGLISSFLALPFSLVTHLLVEWLTLVAILAAQLPFSFFTVAAFPAWTLVLIYLPLTAFALYSYRTASRLPANAHF